MSTPGKFNLAIYQGDTFSQPVRLKSDATTYIDLTAWTARAQIRRKDDDVLIVELDVVVHPVQTGDTKGRIDIGLTDEVTDAMDPAIAGVWDLETTDPDGVVRTLLKGTVKVTKDVTDEP